MQSPNPELDGKIFVGKNITPPSNRPKSQIYDLKTRIQTRNYVLHANIVLVTFFAIPKFSFDIFLKYNPICNPLIRNSPKFSLEHEKKRTI